MGSEPNYDAFLSYNSLDRKLVERIGSELKHRDCSAFLDQWYLTPGHDWVSALERALAASRSVVIFIGPHAIGRWQQRERVWALDRQTQCDSFPVIPVLLPGAEPPLGFLEQLMWIDLRDDPLKAAQMDALAMAVRGGDIANEAVVQPRAMVCPYRGLLSFREEDAEFFFGREAYCKRLLSLVQQNSLVAVVGASGSGKSSLVAAGLVPQLRKRSAGCVWDILRMVPDVDPLYSLAERLVPSIDPDLSKLALERELNTVASDLQQEEPKTPLRSLVNAALREQPGTDRLLLIVDQWEELYTICESAKRRQRFIAELLDATSGANPALSVVLTVRNDFFHELYRVRPLLDRLQDAQLMLGPMNNSELRSAIEGPAAKVGLAFQAGLVDRILKEAGEEPGRLALLGFALEELWKRRDRPNRQLTHAGYQALSGQPGSAPDSHSAEPVADCLSQAIATYAESVYEELSVAERNILPPLFRKLVRAGIESDQDARRRVALSDLDDHQRRVARRLADKRLLTTTLREFDEVFERDRGQDDSGGAAAPPQASDLSPANATVEVAHEELLRRWRRLQGWINEDRQFLLWRSRLDLKVEEFQRDGSAALLTGKPLQEAKTYYAARSGELEDRECRFLDACLTAALKRKVTGGAVALAVLALAMLVVSVVYGVDRRRALDSLVEGLITDSATEIGRYLPKLSEHGDSAVDELRERFRDVQRSEPQRLRAALALTELDAADRQVREFLLDGIAEIPPAEAGALINGLAEIHKIDSLERELSHRVDRASSDADRHRYLAVSLSLGLTERAEAICLLKEDPSPRTKLIHAYKAFPGDLGRVARTIENAHPDLRSAMLVAIGTLESSAKASTEETLLRVYQNAEDGGTHSAAAWALLQQGYSWDDLADSIQPGPATRRLDRGWYVNSQRMTMIRLPGGEFRMGAVDDEKNPAASDKTETFRPVWISDREVTVGQFQKFVEQQQNAFRWVGHEAELSPSAEHPVQNISGVDAVLYCNWLSEREGLEPYYSIPLGQETLADSVSAHDVEGTGYRLPTEREWEYACRAMSAKDFCFGNDDRRGESSLLPAYAGVDLDTTLIGGSRMPNGWGLFDMHGNVYEWCLAVHAKQTSFRVLRSGYSLGIDPQKTLRSNHRIEKTAKLRDKLFGFRVCRSS